MATTKKPRKAAVATAVASDADTVVNDTASDKPQDQPANEPMFREDRIRLAAYKLSLTREPGCADPVADWLEAEAEVDSEDA